MCVRLWLKTKIWQLQKATAHFTLNDAIKTNQNKQQQLKNNNYYNNNSQREQNEKGEWEENYNQNNFYIYLLYNFKFFLLRVKKMKIFFKWLKKEILDKNNKIINNDVFALTGCVGNERSTQSFINNNLNFEP